MSYKKVKVWNDDDKDYVELYKEEEIRIPAHGFIVMQRHDAADFCARWVNPIEPVTGQEKIFKKLRREPLLDEPKEFREPGKFGRTVCPSCRKNCGSLVALQTHMSSYHPELIPVKEKDDSVRTGDISKEQV